MPAPLHVQLTSRQRHRLRELRRDPDLASRERDRVEMYLLSGDGLRVPQLARHFGRCEATMRRWIRQFEVEGLKAVRHKPLGTGPDTVRRQTVRRALNGLLSRKRTWTAPQLAEVLAEEKGLVMKPDTVRKYLHLMGATYRRTKYSLRHRQDPVQATAARERLGALKKRPATGSWTFSSSTRPASVPACPPPTPGAGADTDPPPDRGLPRVVVLDNASIHRGEKVRQARPGLRKQNLHLWYLPAYSPELNDIEHTFRQAKHEAMPQRLQPHARALAAAVHACFRDLQDKLVSLYLSM